MKHILVIDVESNGLRGLPFAVGAVVMDVETEQVVETYFARCPIDVTFTAIDTFVQHNVLPAMDGVECTHKNIDDIIVSFGAWYLRQIHLEPAVFVDYGYPVDFHFLQMTRLDIYPVHELATLLLAAGVNPDISREEYAQINGGNKHHPLFDAEVSAKCVVKAWKQLHAPARVSVSFNQISDDVGLLRANDVYALVNPNAVYRITR